MHKVKVSRRYGNLFVASVLEIDSFGEKQIFPQSKIPLVFRTDATARMVAKMAMEAQFSQNIVKDYSLFAEGCFVCSSTKEVVEEIMTLWEKQNISLGFVEIKRGEVVKHNEGSKSDIVLQAIYRNCV